MGRGETRMGGECEDRESSRMWTFWNEKHFAAESIVSGASRAREKWSFGVR